MPSRSFFMIIPVHAKEAVVLGAKIAEQEMFYDS